MIATPPEIVSYSPAGFGGVMIKPARPPGAWAALRKFLSECANVDGPLDARLVVSRATRWDDAAVAQRLIDETIERFGAPKISIAHSTMFPSGEPTPGGYDEWEVPRPRFAEFRDYVVAGDPWPKQVLGPVELHFHYTFQWRDPDGRGALPAQLAGFPTPDGQQRCRLGVTLARKSRASPSLFFPYAAQDERLRDLLSFVLPILPFNVRPTNFWRGTLKKSGAGYRLQRLSLASVGLADVFANHKPR